MRRLLLAGLPIVAAFLAGAPASAEDVPLTPQMIELADRLYVDPLAAPTRFMPEMVRLLYGLETPKSAPVVPPKNSTHLVPPIVTVPVPLSTDIWSRDVFHRQLTSDQVVAWILSEPRAAVLCRGLAGLDEETLAFFAARPGLVGWLYENVSGVFGAFAHNLHIRDGKVVVRFGDDAAVLWESVTRQSLANPERFVRALFAPDGRLAYLFDVVNAATPPAARFVLGLWMPDASVRLARFRALTAVLSRSYQEWRPLDHSYLRPLGDLAVLLLRVNLDGSGSPLMPASRQFWGGVFNVDPARTAAGVRGAAEDGAGDLIDAAWLVSAFGETNAYQRVDLADGFAFGERLLAGTSAEPGTEVAEILREFRERRMVFLTLERMGIRSPRVYSAVIQRANALDEAVSNRRFWTLAQFQGALALIARMERVGVIDTAGAESLLMSLSAVATTADGEYRGALAAWVRRDWERTLLPGASWEQRVIASVSGRTGAREAPRLVFESEPYRVDLAYAEQQRLVIVRRKQGGHTLDIAMTLQDAAERLRRESGTADEIRETAERLRSLRRDSAEALRSPSVVITPPGTSPSRDALEWLAAEADELDRAARGNDWRHAMRAATSLQQLADLSLGHALLSMTYAAEIGDPDGPALLAGNVALRHDFGFSRRVASDNHPRAPWALPRQEFQPGVPWHVTGSLLGLDVALAQLTLHRLAVDRFGVAPSLSSIEREAFPASVVLLDPRRMKETDVETIATAIARGRLRVDELKTSRTSFPAIADELSLDGYRQRAILWTLQHEPAAIRGQFSLAELLYLGGGAPGVDLDAWGPSGLYGNGCACTWFPPANAWRVLSGRFQLPMMAATMGDLTLAVALKLRTAGFPVALARPVLAIVMQDFFDEQTAAYGGDWQSLSQQAQEIGARSLDDVVSATATINGPLVPENLNPSSRP